jgi:hypothetical protein
VTALSEVERVQLNCNGGEAPYWSSAKGVWSRSLVVKEVVIAEMVIAEVVREAGGR